MKKFTFILLSILILCVTIIVLIARPYYLFLTETLKISPLRTLLGSGDIKKVGNTVNIVILGIAGGNHDGPNLSDSINVIHYDFDTNAVSIIGIPRDVWSPTLEDKINSAYAYGEAKQKGGGIKLAKAEVEGIVGMPIPYGMVISFEKFRELIDYLGGIEVYVEHSFTDPNFPIAGRENDSCSADVEFRCRYETLIFKKGLTHMDGTTALKFVRSRHAEGEEGSDFARNRRQQLVMNAIKNKIISQFKSLNISTISGLYNQGNALIERDISNQEIAVIAKNIFLKKNLKQNNIPLTMNLFEVPNFDSYYGKYVLIPKDNNLENLKLYIRCMISTNKEKKCKEAIGIKI